MKANIFPSSYHQERLWFIDNFENGTLYEAAPVYHNLPLILKIKSRVNQEFLKESAIKLIRRHEALRTNIVMKDEKVFQVINSDREIEIVFHDKQDFSSDDNNIMDFCYERINCPFKIDSELLFRLEIVDLREDETLIIFLTHHSICDRKSLKILADEFILFYNSINENSKIDLPEPSLHYADFTNWQKEFTEENLIDLMPFWREKLTSIEPLIFYTDSPRELIHIFQSGFLSRKLDNENFKKISSTNKNEQLLFLTALQILMQKYSGQNKIAIGFIQENREDDDLEKMIGPISNLVVFNGSIDDHQEMEELLNNNFDLLNQMSNYTLLPFDKLVTELNPEKDMSRTALFDVLFHYEDVSKEEEFFIGHEKCEIIETNLGIGKYDFNFLVKKSNSNYEVHFTFNKLYYTIETAERIMGHYFQILNQVTNKHIKLFEIDITTEEEKRKINDLLNNSSVGWPENETIISLFDKQVKNNNHKTAIIFEKNEMSYDELDKISTQFSEFLKKKNNVKHQDFVAILLPRDQTQIIAILGIIKLGAVYIPIDNEYPEERINYILKDSAAKVCVDVEMFLEFLNVKDQFSNEGQKSLTQTQTNDIVYVIYTSGSTGNPKGVMINNQNVVRLFFNDKPLFDFSENDVWTLFHSYCFDFSVWEIFGALLFGGTLVIIPKSLAIDPEAFLELLSDHKVTVLNQTPSSFNYFLNNSSWQKSETLSLRYVVFGGEILHPIILKDWKEKFPSTKMINMYGITETTVHVTFKELDEENILSNISNIGKPIPTLSCLILNSKKEIVPMLLPGELCVAGKGLALGYLNNEELTSEKFIQNPFESGRLYLSGDIVRLLSNGDIEYLGRKDDQVKIRGFRIELGEVEKALLKKESIQMAVVLAQKNKKNENELVAYFTAEIEQNFTELVSFLKTQLPQHMIPSHFVQTDKLILNNNGKIDKSQLPKYDDFQLQSGKEHVEPRNQTENDIAVIWKEILEKDRIGVYDDFFALGGHSIKAIQLVNAYQKKFNVQLRMKEIFANLTLESQAILIDSARKKESILIEKYDYQDDYPASISQQRLWNISQFSDASIAYNMPVMFEINKALNIEKFKKSIFCIIERHEILRTVFFENPTGELRQKVISINQFNFEVEFNDLQNQTNADSIIRSFAEKDSQRRFDLTKGPLFKVILFQKGKDQFVVYYNFHHIITDGWSMNVINKELKLFYEAFEKNEEPALTELKIQYKDFSIFQRERINDTSFNKHSLFWTNYLPKEIPKLNFKSSKNRPNIKTYNGDAVTREIDSIQLEKIKELVNATKSSIFINLLNITGILIYNYSYQKKIIIGTPTAGRVGKNLEDQIGFYINTIPLKLDIDLQKTYLESVVSLRDEVLEAFEFEDYPFEEIVEDLNQGFDLSRSPLFDAMIILNDFTSKQEDNYYTYLDKSDAITNHSKYDISFVYNVHHKKIDFEIIYNKDLFDREVIEQFQNDFFEVLNCLLRDNTLKIEGYIKKIINQEEQVEQQSFLNDLNIEMNDDF